MIDPAADTRDAGLTELVLGAHLDYMRASTVHGGGAVEERDGLLLLAGAHAAPILVNIACRTRPGMPAAEVIERAAAFFEPRDRRFEVVFRDGGEPDLVEAATALGYDAGSADPLQVLDRRPTVPRAADGLEVRVVDDERGVGDVIAVNEDAYSVFRIPADFFRSIFGRPATILDPDLHVIVASEHGSPVATGQLRISGDVGYIAWVGVVRAATRRGLGRFVVATLASTAFDRGARIVTLMASSIGAPLYRSMGFVDVGGAGSLTSPERTA